MEKLRSTLKVALFVVATAWLLHTTAKNFAVDPNFKKFLLEKNAAVLDWTWFVALRVHIILALVALLAGPFGFLERLRKRNIELHRLVGRIYVVSILLNFVPSIYLALFATGGVASVLGFLLLNAIWVGTTYQAYRAIRRKKVWQHRAWMIRSYAVTLANLQLYILKTMLNKAAGLNAESAYTIAVWSCWLIGLLVAEIVIRKLSRRRSPVQPTKIDLQPIKEV
jgi:uncharacterized membrane protein